MLAKVVIAGTLLLVVAACGAGAPGEHCSPGEEVACNCPDGTQSIKQCKSDGTWGQCQCVGL